MKKIVIAYIPVLHSGYVKFLKKHSNADTIYIFGEDVIKRFDHLAKEIRALEPKEVRAALRPLGFKNVKILSNKDIARLSSTKALFVFPMEDISEELAAQFFKGKKVKFDPVFLRWDKHKSTEKKSVKVGQKVTKNRLAKIFMQKAVKNSRRSSDWWRRVGSIVVKDGKVVVSTYNRHVPSPHSPYVSGDPRNNFHKGVNVELSTAMHSEAGAIAKAAKMGISLEGAEMYVSTFPCPPCAKLIAYSGIKKLYYAGGYGVLDGEAVLKSQGVKIIFVDLK